MTMTDAFLGGPSRVWENLMGDDLAFAWPAFHWEVPWAVLVALGVWGLALVIKHFLTEVIEDEQAYARVIIGFLAVYVVAAFAVGALNPTYAR